MRIFDFDDGFIQSLLQHDDEAFALFYHKTSDHFFRYVVSHYTISHADAQDILSDVYLKIRNGLDHYDPTYTFGQYIWTILKNHCKDYCKKVKPLLFSEITTFHNDDKEYDMSSFLEDEDPSGDVATMVAQDFTLSSIHKAIASFDANDQQLLHEKFVLGYGYDDLAAMYGQNSDAMRQKISRLVRKLRGLLAHTKDM